MTNEERRLAHAHRPRTPWTRWRPYRAGLAAIADDRERLCLSVVLRNGYGDEVQPEGSYLDSTPTYSYMRYLSCYPQGGGAGLDVLVEYAKASPEDILARITVGNRGSAPASVHVVPRLWLREGAEPWLCDVHGPDGAAAIEASHPELGDRYLYYDGAPEVVYTCRAEDGVRAVADYRATIDRGAAFEIRLRLTIAPPETRHEDTLGDDFTRVFLVRQQEAVEFCEHAQGGGEQVPRCAIAIADVA